MKTPWTLHKTETTEPATGLLLWTESAADLLQVCVALGAEADPRIHAVAGGFLLRLARPSTQVFPETIRLRQLTPNLFLPVDAELWPTLFPDEAAGLVKQHGLIVLPGGRILAFSPDRPIALGSLLQARRLPAAGWRPLPAIASLADRLTEIVLDRPNESPDAVLEPGGEGIGVEEPQAPEVGPGASAAAQFKQGLGQSLSWMGRALNWKWLAGKGRDMMEAARRKLQSVSERVLDRQEAALRELLRQFQEGQLDDALRRALPLGEQGGRGSTLANSAQLPTHNLNWSLGPVISGGPAGLWMGGAELQMQLAAEYRKAAEAATARGDYRRAAFIYARLLRDYRLAAGVLGRGGLHHDAAILYLDKLNDVLAAAREFEAAGELDRAVALYRQRLAYVPAGDLLRKMGEEEQARREYHLAIEQLQRNQEHHGAGELALQKLHDGELAESCFREGWEQRPRLGALACLLRLAQLLADRPTPADLWSLIEDAEPFLVRQGTESDTTAFFNELVRLANRPHLAGSRDSLRDRALLALAGRLRLRGGIEARAGNLVSTLLGQSNLWSAAQVSDAEAAVKAAVQTRKVQKKPAAQRGVVQVRIHAGTVTAACLAADRGKLFLAFEDGALRAYNPSSGSTTALVSSSQPITALVTDRQGELLAGLCGGQLVCHACDEPMLVAAQRNLGPLEDPQLSPLIRCGDEPVLVVWDQENADVLRGPTLLPVQRRPLPEITMTFPGQSALSAFLGILPLVLPGDPNQAVALLAFDDHNVTLCRPTSTRLVGAPLGWIAQPAPTLSGQVFRSWVQGERLHVELVRVGSVGGHIYWSRLCLDGDRIETAGAAVSKTHPYLAAAMVVPKRIAAVREGGIDWLRIHGRQLVVDTTTEINLGGAAGCFFSPPTGEVLVVCRDGYLVRVSVPQ